jgi:hypothetical protein
VACSTSTGELHERIYAPYGFTAVANGQQRSAAITPEMYQRPWLGGRTVLPKLAVRVRVLRPLPWSAMPNGGFDLDLGALGVRVLKEFHALLLSSVGAVAGPRP